MIKKPIGRWECDFNGDATLNKIRLYRSKSVDQVTNAKKCCNKKCCHFNVYIDFGLSNKKNSK